MFGRYNLYSYFHFLGQVIYHSSFGYLSSYVKYDKLMISPSMERLFHLLKSILLAYVHNYWNLLHTYRTTMPPYIPSLKLR